MKEKPSERTTNKNNIKSDNRGNNGIINQGDNNTVNQGVINHGGKNQTTVINPKDTETIIVNQ